MEVKFVFTSFPGKDLWMVLECPRANASVDSLLDFVTDLLLIRHMKCFKKVCYINTVFFTFLDTAILE